MVDQDFVEVNGVIFIAVDLPGVKGIGPFDAQRPDQHRSDGQLVVQPVAPHQYGEAEAEGVDAFFRFDGFGLIDQVFEFFGDLDHLGLVFFEQGLEVGSAVFPADLKFQGLLAEQAVDELPG